MRRRRRGPYLAGGLVLVIFVALGVVAAVIATSTATLSPDGAALARIGMPLGGGTVERVTVLSSPKQSLVGVQRRGDQLWPTQKIPAHERVEILVTIKRPGWISWLAGSTEHLKLYLTAPSASLRSHYLTVKSGAPVVLHFKQGIRAFAYGNPGQMVHRTFATPTSLVTIPRSAPAGTIYVNAAVRSWESAKDAQISWFPAGGAATAVASPAPGTQIAPHTKITLTFSRPIAKALGTNLPPVTPAGAGSWHQTTTHAIQFVPSGYGYGLGANVAVALPSGVHLVGGSQTGDSVSGKWTVPGGSTLRLQQLLSQLGYLPFKFSSSTTISDNAQAQEQAAISPPKGSFNWAYPNVPGPLRNEWSAGSFGTMTKGAVMAFEDNNNLTTDGVPGATVWKTLITDADAGKGGTNFGYTYVMVSEGSPESEQTWHNGKFVVSGPVNTGIPEAPTATGVYPVFEHVPVTTMSGINPDGSHYSDPGIQWVSYFNGGDALHEFPRGSYGFPQSLGCVEMPLGEAASVYPYTPIGTLVNVS